MTAAAYDHYAVLGVKEDANEDDVRSAYRTLARKQHPDVCKDADAGDKFKAIQRAFNTLSDPVARAAYDRERSEARYGPVPQDIMDTLLDNFADFLQQRKKPKAKAKRPARVKRAGAPDVDEIPDGYDVPEDPFFSH